MVEVHYVCQGCGSKEISTWNITPREADETAKYGCHCPECGVQNDLVPGQNCAVKVLDKVCVRVTFANGEELTTWINTDFEGAQKYYLNQVFNLGIGDRDDLQPCVRVEAL